MKYGSLPIVVLGLLLISGCMRHDIQMYESVDHSEKSVTVPAGSSGLKGELKQFLSTAGWSMAVYRGPEVFEGDIGQDVRIEKSDTFNTRYRLFVTSRRYDWCLNFSPAVKYDISFVDNATGSEVFTINGRGCEPDVLKHFQDALGGMH